MLKHRGFSAWITSNGALLPEYLVAISEEDHQISCWIPGQEGQNFQVYWQDHNGKVDSCGFIVLDGLVVPGRFLFGDGIASRGGIRSSLNTERPFVFQKVSDGPKKGTYKGSSKDTGMIILKIKRINRTVARPANRVQSVPSVLGKRKVGDLCVGFGPETKSFDQHNSTWDFEPYDEAKPGSKKAATYVSFVFRYRSPEFLLNQGISTEVKTVPTPKRQSVRRVASTPLRNESDTSPEAEVPEPLRKRPRLERPKPSVSARQAPTDSRRSSGESRRAASWNATPTTANLGPYHGESQFFLPRNVTYSYPSTSTRAPNFSNDPPAIPDTDTSAKNFSKVD